MAGRVEEYDYLRAFAIAAVVTIHVVSPSLYHFGDAPIVGTYSVLLSQWSRFSVPLFLFVSGACLMLAYSGREFSYGDFIKRRLTVVGLPYVAWSLVFELKKSGFDPGGFDAARFASDLLQGNAVAPYYFIPLIIQFYLLFPLFMKMTRAVEGSAGRMVSALVSLAVVQMASLFVLELIRRHYGFKYPPGIRCLFVIWLLYFSLGCLWGPIRRRFVGRGGTDGRLMAAIVVFALALLPVKYYFTVVLPGAGEEVINGEAGYFRGEVLAYFALVLPFVWAMAGRVRLRGGPVLKKALRLLGDYAYGIYLTHLLVVPYLLSLTAKIDGEASRVVAMTLIIIATLAVCLVVLWVANRVPVLCMLTGAHPARRRAGAGDNG